MKKHMRNFNSQRGFTLIEMLTAITITSLVLLGVMTFLANTLVNHSVQTARQDLIIDTQLALDALTKDVRLSASVDATNRWPDDNSPDAAVTGGYGWESDSTTLVLALSAEDSNKDIIFEDALHYITYKNNAVYFVNDGKLYKRILAGGVSGNAATTSCPASAPVPGCPTDRLLVDGVSAFTVRYIDGDNAEVDPSLARSVEVTLSLAVERYGRQITADYATRTVFRNE